VSKYKAKKTLYNGVWYGSRKEAQRAWELDMLLFAGEISDLRRQVPFQLSVCKYVADFVYKNKDGNEVVEDCKGYRTDIYRLKKKMMKHELGIDIYET